MSHRIFSVNVGTTRALSVGTADGVQQTVVTPICISPVAGHVRVRSWDLEGDG